MSLEEQVKEILDNKIMTPENLAEATTQIMQAIEDRLPRKQTPPNNSRWTYENGYNQAIDDIKQSFSSSTEDDKALNEKEGE